MDNAQKTLLQIITHHRQNPLDFININLLWKFRDRNRMLIKELMAVISRGSINNVSVKVIPGRTSPKPLSYALD
jgi:hypothetical protein